jgi:outer membrane protein assembly factor BamB
MKRVLLGIGVLAALATGALATRAQRLDPKRPKTIVVGAPREGSPTARGDARRTGLSRTPLPTRTLDVAWRKSLSAPIEGPPLVNASGDVIVTTARGEVLVLDGSDGSERPHGIFPTSPPVGAPALAADGTTVFTTTAGDAIGVKNGALRFRTRVGDGRVWHERAGVLALDDGGTAVAVGTELAVLDAEGQVRARASLEEPIAAPLVAAPIGRVVAITSSGRVFMWTPGREPLRAGSFGAPVDGAAALVDDHTLVAVSGIGQLVELDLARGVAVARMSSAAILLGPPALRGDVAYVLAALPGRVFALAVDGSGQETMRVSVQTTTPQLAPDGGPLAAVVPLHTGPIVDGAGTLAFGTADGYVGVVSASGVDQLGEVMCMRSAGLAGPRPSPAPPVAAFAGLAPAGPSAFVVACETGVVVKVTARPAAGESNPM